MKWTDWVILLLPVALTGGLGWFFNNKLEKQKHLLQKKVQDYSLFNEKKHTSYAEVYKLIKMSEGYVFSLRGYNETLALTDFNAEDLKKYLKDFMPNAKIDTVVSMWDNKNFREAEKIVREYEKLRDLRRAENSFYEAKNFWLLNELYFEKDINEILKEYFDALLDLFLYYKFPDKETKNDEIITLQRTIKEKFELLRSSMRKDLSIEK
ncbi:hypothetical protein MOC96_14700 [Bacillus vallismortis]|uniref:hypothetical protein n=1 Tax=Bacillus vallismortis TaxID=72361 RepID=UPI00228297F3|nr:hypothetical protein [Bacillus vallismortis]MCY8309963.1 hypothetical protein [Bacillus vallismortis]